MPSRRTLDAGKAVITLSLDDRVSKGLKSFQARLNRISGSITGIGTKLGAAGSVISGVFAGAVGIFTKTGDALNKMSLRTGFSAAALSELSHAAGTSGTDLKTFEAGIRGMQRQLLNADEGLQTSVDTFDALGLSVDAIKQLKPEDQFTVIADAISKVEDPSRKAALAMRVFGKSGSQLLPLLHDGADGMEALRQEARDLGLVIGDDAAQRAANLEDAFGRLWGQMKTAVFWIGDAVAGPLNKFLDMTRAINASVIDWIRENSALIAGVAGAGVILTAAGAAFVGVGTAVQVAAFAAGGLATAIATTSAVIGAILSPIGLAVTAVAGLTAAFFTMTDTGRQLAASISETFGGMFKTVSESVSAMASLLAAGEIEAAGKVLWASLDMLWAQGTVALQGVWQTFLGGITKTWDAAWAGMMLGVNSVWGSLERGWSHIGETIGNIFDRAVGAAQVALNELYAYMEKLWAEIKGFFGADLQGEIDRINRELEASNEILRGQTQGKIDARSAAAEAARQRSLQTDAGAAAVIGGNLNAADAATDSKANAAASAAQKQLDAAKAAWADARAAADSVKIASDQSIAKEVERLQPSIDAAGEVASAGGSKAVATLDASFAAQQFGQQGNSREVDLLTRIEQNGSKLLERMTFEGGIPG